MTNEVRGGWLMIGARRALADATAGAQSYVSITAQCQQCVEYCARAVIHTVREPSWGHGHSRELEEILDAHARDLRTRFGREQLRRLRQLARDDWEMAPWRSRTMYGYSDENHVHHPPDEICTQQVAERSLELARRSLDTAERFLAELVGSGGRPA